MLDQMQPADGFVLTEQVRPRIEAAMAVRKLPKAGGQIIEHDINHVRCGASPAILNVSVTRSKDIYMKQLVTGAFCLLSIFAWSADTVAQTMPADHHRMPHASLSTPQEAGQGAFAAISEIVEILRADPKTDWSRVDVEALRRHLIDMDNVTLRASVAAVPVDGGARFDVTSDAPSVTASIRRMALAHSAAVTGMDGMTLQAGEIPSGARVTVTGANPAMIRGLGFIGVMTLGMHHQAHHLAIARGTNPHAH